MSEKEEAGADNLSRSEKDILRLKEEIPLPSNKPNIRELYGKMCNCAVRESSCRRESLQCRENCFSLSCIGQRMKERRHSGWNR